MSGKRYLCIKNFYEQQHYKDRNPIWIKLPCALLDDYRFARIPDDAKFHAVGLMLLASRLDNKFPDDEVWLRRKINAEKKIDIKLLLEIEFLEVIKNKKLREKMPTMTRKSMKTQGESASTTLTDENYCASATFNSAENCASTEQNRTEENRTEHNTTQQTKNKRAAEPDAKNGVVCVDSENLFQSEDEKPGDLLKSVSQTNKNESAKHSIYSIEECLRYVEACQAKGEAVNSPNALANHLHKTGEADALIMATLYPKDAATLEREQFGEPFKFTDESCRVCFGAKMADVDGKGYRACVRCKNERGKSTGFEPEGESNVEE